MAYSSTIGLIHIIFSVLSLIFGTWIIFTNKGTGIHKKVGYVYTICMYLVCISALMLYRLTGTFGIFHFFALYGLITISIGIGAAIFRKPAKNWLFIHLYCMYWSVIGLYAAFAAAVSVRVPQTPFWWMVGVSSGAVSIIGTIVYMKKKEQWSKLADMY